MEDSLPRRPTSGSEGLDSNTGAGSDGAPCPFCDLTQRKLIAENELAAAFRDGFPVNPGHTLIIPKRHVPTWFDATREEQLAILGLTDRIKTQRDAELAFDGYNGGFNAGEAAGQTVPDLHLHVIPRFRGDVDDSTGGVRFVIPARGNYRRAGFIPTSREITLGRPRGPAPKTPLSLSRPLFQRDSGSPEPRRKDEHEAQEAEDEARSSGCRTCNNGE